ncbi:hypothetical protein FJ434_06280 [Mesorhizobium sp. B2-5-13]|uniref:hypothetical protein n=1 Tax=unclassified Mesorhizobium TaxID=325217 RepID=UPI00112A4AB3|nr:MULTISPECIES: hypothetical protein [unclassified Mesorhizobium]TPJ90609.1 hypothetical protein FJ434_06280 [Mesorhizobium sp. B2-5-13]TPK54758.1 hypothetical protein FJ560_02195 [Mesorhizobium sp. B2-5-5]
MRTFLASSSVLGLALGAIVVAGGASFAADTHAVATKNVAWTYNGKASTKTTPLIVDDLKIGDIVEIQIDGAIPHGFVTIRTKDGTSTEAKDLVWACGQDKGPNVVLRETDCGAASQFGVQFKGKMRLEVLDTFKDPVDFWCVIHLGGMRGTLKLKP